MPNQLITVDLTPPDISAYRTGNVGVDYVTCMDSGVAGPHVLLNAVMHGNELCGAIALDYMFRHDIRPQKGRLSFSFANYQAFLNFNPETPYISRFVDEDMNRVWVEGRLNGNETSWELNRARALRPFIGTVDYLLDIHSMSTLSAPVTLCNGLEKERALVSQIGFPEYAAHGSGFVQGRRLIEYTPFHDTNNHKVGLLVECGQHWHRQTAVTALDAALYFLRTLEIVSQDVFEAHVTADPPPPFKELEITGAVYSKTNQFEFVEAFKGMEIIAQAGTEIARDGGVSIQTPYDNCVLVMPNHSVGRNMRVVRFARIAG